MRSRSSRNRARVRARSTRTGSRTPTAATRCCSSSPTAWAATPAARSPRRSPCGCSSSASSRRRSRSSRTRSSSCRTRCCARTRRSAPTRTSSRCSRRRARPASPASSRRATRTGRTSAIRASTSSARAALIGQTKDHSKVQYLVDQGIIGADDVAEHPDRNKIFSCLGGLVDPVIDLGKRTPLRNGDILVHVHRRPVERDEQGGDRDLAHVDADPQDGAADDARGREARRRRRRQPVGDRRALGSGDAHRRAVDDDHRDARASANSRRRSTAR